MSKRKREESIRNINPMLVDLRERLAKVETRIDGFDGRLDGFSKRLDKLEKRLEGIDSRIWYLLVGVGTTLLVTLLSLLK